MRVVTGDLDDSTVKLVDIAAAGSSQSSRQRTGLARELRTRLVQVVEIEVRVAERVHEVTHLEIA